MTLLLAPWKWLALPAVALATAAGTGLVGPAGSGDGPPAPAAPVAAKVAPPPASPATLEASGKLHLLDSKEGPVDSLDADSIVVRGTMADLAGIVGKLRESDPAATYELKVSGGTVRLRDLPPQDRPKAEAVAPPATLKPQPPQPDEEEDPQDVIVPPLIRTPGGTPDLGPNPPAGYFDLPAADSSKPGSPRPVQVGQKVQIEVLEALPGRPITGTRVVRPDGTISLGFYGDLPVVGLNRDQIKVKLIEKLRHYLLDKTLGLVSHDSTYAGPGLRSIAVPPVQSDRVFVDDQPDPDASTPTPALAPRRPSVPPARPAPAAPARPKGEGAAAVSPAAAPAGARLEAALTGEPTRYTGQPITYRVTVTNAGGAPAEGFRVVATLPTQGGRLARIPAGAKFLPNPRTITWGATRLDPGATFEQEFRYETSGPGSYGCIVEAVAGEARAEAAAKTEVAAAAFLDLKVSQADRVVDVGTKTFYELVINNHGTRAATNLAVGGSLANLKVVKLFADAGAIPAPGEGVPELGGLPSRFAFPKIPRLGPGESITLSLEVEALGGPQATADVTLTCDEMADQGGPVRGAIATRVITAPGARPAEDAPLRSPPVEVGQTLVVEVLEALPGRPITGERTVRPDGTISLGFYGDVLVAGLTRDEVKVKVVEHLRKSLTDEALGLKVAEPRPGQAASVPPLQSDRVFVDRADFDLDQVARGPGPDGRVRVGQLVAVEALEALRGRPITGWRLVGPDGRINLGFYGDVAAAGLTRAELKETVIEHLRGKLSDEQLGLVADDGRAVPPADSTKVYVDDVVPAREPDGEVERLRREVAELNGKLDDMSRTLGRIGRGRTAPAPRKP